MAAEEEQAEETRVQGTDKISGNGKGKGHGGKGEHGCRGGSGSKRARQHVRQYEEDERVQVAPNKGASGSYLQATSNTEEGEETEEGQQRNEEKEL